MAAWFSNSILSTTNYIDMLLRILVSAICGGFIGWERERRLKTAGLRTHIIVALAATVMMIVSKYGFMDIVGLNGLRLQTDGSRIAAAVVQAISFIGAGVIYVKRENVIGLTTAAGLWATVGVGLAIGCGLYTIGIISTILILIVHSVLHKFRSKVHFQNVGTVKCNITKHNIQYRDFESYISSLGATIRDISMERTDNGDVLTAYVLFGPCESITDLMEKLYSNKLLDSVSINPVL